MDKAVSWTANDRSKLQDLRDRIVAAQDRLKLKNSFHDGHQARARELLSRYELLQSQLAADVEDMESHGHHVSRLEKSVLDWVNGLEFDR